MAQIYTYGLGTRSEVLEPAFDEPVEISVSGDSVKMMGRDMRSVQLLAAHSLPSSARPLIVRSVHAVPHYRVRGGTSLLVSGGDALGVAHTTLSYEGRNETREQGGVSGGHALTVHELLPGSDLVYIIEDGAQWQSCERLFVLREDARLVVLSLMRNRGSIARTSHVVLAGKNAHASWYEAGYYAGTGKSDTHVVLTHAGEGSCSELVMRSVHGDTSQSIIQGSIVMAPGSHGAQGRQDLGALMDSPHAQVNPVPHLFTYHDRVTCSHAARVARISPRDMFYCASRGIPPEQAREALTHSYLMDAFPSHYSELISELFFYDMR